MNGSTRWSKYRERILGGSGLGPPRFRVNQAGLKKTNSCHTDSTGDKCKVPPEEPTLKKVNLHLRATLAQKKGQRTGRRILEYINQIKFHMYPQ